MRRTDCSGSLNCVTSSCLGQQRPGPPVLWRTMHYSLVEQQRLQPCCISPLLLCSVAPGGSQQQRCAGDGTHEEGLPHSAFFTALRLCSGFWLLRRDLVACLSLRQLCKLPSSCRQTAPVSACISSESLCSCKMTVFISICRATVCHISFCAVIRMRQNHTCPWQPFGSV